MKVKQLLVGGGSPAAVLALGEDGSVFVLETKLRQAGPVAPVFDGRSVLEYSWRRLPALPDPAVQ